MGYLEEGVEIWDFDIYSAGDVGPLLEQSGLTVHHAGVHGDAHLLGREEGVHVVHVLGGRGPGGSHRNHTSLDGRRFVDAACRIASTAAAARILRH